MSLQSDFMENYLEGLITLAHALGGVIHDLDSHQDEKNFAEDRLRQLRKELEVVEGMIVSGRESTQRTREQISTLRDYLKNLSMDLIVP